MTRRRSRSCFVDLFLNAHPAPPPQITLDLDATDDPLHGHQEERFFHGYYDTYCYLPLYVFCGRHLLAAKLRPANIDASAGSIEEVARIVAQIRGRWPQVRILLRADSGFVEQAGNYPRGRHVSREQPVDGGQRFRRRVDPLRISDPAGVLQSGQGVHTAATAPLLVAQAAHHAGEKC